MAPATARTASANASSLPADGDLTPLTFLTYWRAAASISSRVAGGSRPRRMVMFRHMEPKLSAQPPWTTSALTARDAADLTRATGSCSSATTASSASSMR